MNGQEVKEFRARHNLSQARMAEILGTSRNRIRELERGAGEGTDEIEDSLLSEWTVEQQEEDRSQPPDELPAPPYDPDGSEPPAEDEEEEKPKRRRRSGPRAKKLTAWQEETAAALIALTQGTVETLEVNGAVVEVPVPGVCALIARVDPFDANVLYAGSPAFWTALVKVAPRHPWLRGLLEMLTMGGEYNELTRASLAIAIPILMHHGVIPTPQFATGSPQVSGAEPEQGET